MSSFENNFEITAEQCLGARAMLSLKREELSKLAKVAVATIADFETKRRSPHPRTNRALWDTLEAAGVEFIPEDEAGGAGLRLKKEK